jgi:hypothetical protein
LLLSQINESGGVKSVESETTPSAAAASVSGNEEEVQVSFFLVVESWCF